MSVINWLEFNTTQSDVEDILNGNSAVFVPPEDDSFGENLESSNRWLLSIFISYFFKCISYWTYY